MILQNIAQAETEMPEVVTTTAPEITAPVLAPITEVPAVIIPETKINYMPIYFIIGALLIL